MRAKQLYLLISLLICANHIPRANGIIETISFGIAVGTFVMDTWDFVEKLTKLNDPDDGKLVSNKFTELFRKMDQFESKYENNIEWAMSSLKRIKKNNIRLDLQMNSLNEIMNMITIRYKEMEQYEKLQNGLENTTLLNFAEFTVSAHTNAVKSLLERIHLIFLGNNEIRTFTRGGVLKKMAEVFKDENEFYCNTWQSPQQFIYSLYADVALAELKGYALMQFSWMRLRMYGKGNFTEEANLMRREYTARTERSLTVFRDVMRQSSRVVWRCDPERHVKGQTYDEITRFWQGSIEDEKDMDPSRFCWNDCNDFDTARNRYIYGCDGQIRNCYFAGDDVTFCKSPSNNTRRYEYIENGSGRTFGHKTQCSTRPKTYSTYRDWLMVCNFCLCLCDEGGPTSDRYFSLREVISNVHENRVVTGLRMIKSNRVFHIQIQEGQLLPRGMVNKSTLQWKPIDDYDTYDYKINANEDYSIHDTYDYKINANEDYFILSWERRALDLNVIEGDNSNVVTGLRFRAINDHLYLDLHVTTFYFDKGHLGRTSMWISDGPKSVPVNLHSSDVPTRTLAPSVPTSKPNEFIEFTNSGWDKDAAQTTVPFIDIQEVTSDPPVPLAGIGLYHKRQKGYGGFIAPKIITYDFAPHVELPTYITQSP